MPSQQISFSRIGRGPPLLLIHGTGLTRRVWDPLIGLLQDRRELLLVDLPGHGVSPPPRPEIEATPIGYARALAALLTDLGLSSVDVAGNSVGGWTALELAKLGRARAVVALAPAGLWPDRDPLSAWGQLWLNYQLTRLFRPVIPFVLGRRLGRSIFLRQVVGDPHKVPAQAATQLALSWQEGAGVREHLLAMRRIVGFRGGRSITAPITVVWGEKERIIPKAARSRDYLPAPHPRTRVTGCGHVMSWDDPQLVARTILEATRTG